MRIRLVRTGGLAGLRRSAAIDTEALDPPRAARIARLVKEANLESFTPAAGKRTREPDRFRYCLTIEEAGRERTVEFAEEETPPSVQRLLRTLWREADAGSEPPDLKRV